MFTIHTIHNNHYIPLIFCLLPNKQKEIYRYLFIISFLFIYRYLYVDFEEVIHNSILSVSMAGNKY